MSACLGFLFSESSFLLAHSVAIVNSCLHRLPHTCSALCYFNGWVWFSRGTGCSVCCSVWEALMASLVSAFQSMFKVKSQGWAHRGEPQTLYKPICHSCLLTLGATSNWGVPTMLLGNRALGENTVRPAVGSRNGGLWERLSGYGWSVWNSSHQLSFDSFDKIILVSPS